MKPPVFDPAWPDEVQALYRHDMREIWDPEIARHVWNQYHNQLDVYAAYASPPPIDILDVGCAQGTLALLLAERGHRVTAVDLRPHFLAYARSRLTHGDVRFIQGDVLHDDLPAQYDLIFANQLVEHLVRPHELVERLRDRLRPGGRLIMTTPNADYVKNDLPTFGSLGDASRWEHMQNTADADGHFYAYTASELKGVFDTCGMHRVQTRFFETPWISGHMKLRYLHRAVPVPVLRLLDRFVLALPLAGRRLAHQLLVTGVRPA